MIAKTDDFSRLPLCGAVQLFRAEHLLTCHAKYFFLGNIGGFFGFVHFYRGLRMFYFVLDGMEVRCDNAAELRQFAAPSVQALGDAADKLVEDLENRDPSNGIDGRSAKWEEARRVAAKQGRTDVRNVFSELAKKRKKR